MKTLLRENKLEREFIYIFLLSILIMLLDLLVKDLSLSFVSFIIFSILLIKWAKISPLTFVLYSFFFYMLSFQLFSNSLLELGTFSIELSEFGFPNSSGVILNVTNMFFLLAMVITSKYYERINFTLTKVPKYLYPIIIGLSSLVLMLLFISGVKHGFPLMKGMLRQTYWKSYNGNNVVIMAYGRINIFIFLLGICYWNKNVSYKKNVILILAVLLIIIQVLYGVKFSGLVISIYSFIMSSYMAYSCNNKYYKYFIKKGVKYFLVLCSIFIILITYSYRVVLIQRFDNASTKKIIEMAMNRVVLQGQLFWKAKNYYESEKYKGELRWLQNEIVDGFLRRDYPDEDAFSGMMILVKELASRSVSIWYPRDNVTLTAGGEAILLIHYGYLGLFIIKILIGILTFILIFQITKELTKFRVVELLLLNELLWYLLVGGVFDARTQRFFDPKVLIIILIYLAIKILRKYKEKIVNR